MGRFAKIEEVAPTQRGQVFKKGLYAVLINACKIVDGQRGDTYFIIEAEVLESDNNEIKVGAQHSQVINLTNKKAGDAPYSDVKAFIASVLNMRPDEAKVRIGEKAMEFVAMEGKDGNPFEGVKMGLQVDEQPPTGKRATPFTYHKWVCIDDDQAEKLREGFNELNVLKAA